MNLLARYKFWFSLAVPVLLCVVAFFFGYMSYMSYRMLQAYTGGWKG